MTGEPGSAPPKARTAGAVSLILGSNLYVAVCVASLGWWVASTLGAVASAPVLLALLCGTLVIYNLDHLRDDDQRVAANPAARPRLDRALRRIVLGVGAAGLALAFFAGGASLVVAALPAGLVGLAYGARLGDWRLKDLPGAKAWIVAGAVTQACLWLPVAPRVPGLRETPVALFVLALTALNAHCFDLRDLDVDDAGGVRTWALRLGGRAAHRRLAGLTAGASGLAGLAAWWGLLPVSAPATLALACLTLALVRPGAPRRRYGVVVDGWLLLPAVASVVLPT